MGKLFKYRYIWDRWKERETDRERKSENLFSLKLRFAP